jgi:hypothetical protein
MSTIPSMYPSVSMHVDLISEKLKFLNIWSIYIKKKSRTKNRYLSHLKDEKFEYLNKRR